MNTMKRILAVLDGSDADVGVLTKAVTLARRHAAALELFLCDAEHAFALQHAYDPTGVGECRRAYVRQARRYLESVRDTAVGADVRIAVDATCETPLYEGIVRKVLSSGADFVVKSAAGAQSLQRFALDANDWQLVRTCPAALLLCRGRSWLPCPKIAAAVDVSEHGAAELPRAIMETSARLAQGCRGELDILYSEPGNTDPRQHEAHLSRLLSLARDAGLDDGRVHLVSGDPDHTLPGFAAGRGYDAFIMGALTHRPGLATLVGTLTSRLVESLDCDFVLVKPAGFQTPVESIIKPSREETVPQGELAIEPTMQRDFISPWQLPTRHGS
jgi:universal stress protein E